MSHKWVPLYVLLSLFILSAHAALTSPSANEQTSINTSDQSASSEPPEQPITTQANNNNTTEGGDNTNSTKSLYDVFNQLKDIKNWMKEPYVHGFVLPAVVGVSAALVTVSVLCCIHSCVRSTARRRRKRRIRHLANDLKTDRAMLLGDESDEEF